MKLLNFKHSNFYSRFYEGDDGWFIEEALNKTICLCNLYVSMYLYVALKVILINYYRVQNSVIILLSFETIY